MSKHQLLLGLVYLARPAYRALAASLESEDDAVRLKAANSILDRLGVNGHSGAAPVDERPENLSRLSVEELAERARGVLHAVQALAPAPAAVQDAADGCLRDAAAPPAPLPLPQAGTQDGRPTGPHRDCGK